MVRLNNNLKSLGFMQIGCWHYLLFQLKQTLDATPWQSNCNPLQKQDATMLRNILKQTPTFECILKHQAPAVPHSRVQFPCIIGSYSRPPTPEPPHLHARAALEQLCCQRPLLLLVLATADLIACTVQSPLITS